MNALPNHFGAVTIPLLQNCKRGLCVIVPCGGTGPAGVTFRYKDYCRDDAERWVERRRKMREKQTIEAA